MSREPRQHTVSTCVSILDILPARPSDWAAVVERMEETARTELGVAVARAWIDGSLEDLVRAQFASERAMWGALATACEVFGDVAIERDLRSIDEGVARRWCWIRAWHLWDQDEDLALMGDAFVTPLLEEAAADCPKRDYAISIVEHHLRDHTHGALRRGWSQVREQVAGYARWLPALRAVERAAYVERLIGYAQPGKVSRADAEQRVRDFWRCYAPRDVALEAVGDGWRARIDSTRAWIVVERKTGAMRIE